MAKIVLTASLLLINAVDYSAQVESVELATDVPEVDVTNMLSLGWKELLGGIKSAGLSVSWKKDAVLTGLDAFLFANLGTLQTFEVRLVNTARSTTNPGYTGSVLITKHNIGGRVGEAFGGQSQFPVSGAVTRNTS